jgi:hypothetical protein
VATRRAVSAAIGHDAGEARGRMQTQAGPARLVGQKWGDGPNSKGKAFFFYLLNKTALKFYFEQEKFIFTS